MARKDKVAKADVVPVRQATQYACMPTSLSMCLRANGVPPEECTPDLVNKVMGAQPMKGAAWEQALAAAQHYGMRATLVVPSTIKQLKSWTDQGIPVMIAWNPNNRDWSHASVVFDVDDDMNVHVADPNIVNPSKTSIVVPEDEFYSKWLEKWPNYLVRRPACAIEREIKDGKQVMAKMNRTASPNSIDILNLLQTKHWPVLYSAVEHGDMNTALHEVKEINKLQDAPGMSNKVINFALKASAFSLFDELEHAVQHGNVERAQRIVQKLHDHNIMRVWGSLQFTLQWQKGMSAEKIMQLYDQKVKTNFGGEYFLDYGPNYKKFSPYTKEGGRISETMVERVASAHLHKKANLSTQVFLTNLVHKVWPTVQAAIADNEDGEAADLLKHNLRALNSLTDMSPTDKAEMHTVLTDLLRAVQQGDDHRLEVIVPRIEQKWVKHWQGLLSQYKTAKKKKPPKMPQQRDPAARAWAEGQVSGDGKHQNRKFDVEKGRSRKPKHKKPWE